MLIGSSPKRPNLEQVRRIKKALHEVLSLPQEAMIVVTELACIEEGCAPLETVIGLLRPKEPQIQYKLHKAIAEIDVTDLVQVCSKWGFIVKDSAFERFFH